MTATAVTSTAKMESKDKDLRTSSGVGGREIIWVVLPHSHRLGNRMDAKTPSACSSLGGCIPDIYRPDA